MAQRLAALGGDRQPPTARWAPRELDVLAQIALVKAYLRGAMSKLGAHTRFEAVVAARRARLLP